MILDIRLFTGLKCNNRELTTFGLEEFNQDVPEGITIEQLHQILRLKSNLPLINLINGLAKSLDYVLQEGDRVGIFPPVGGG